MKLNRWLVAFAVLGVAAVGTSVQAGLFDRMRDRSSESADRKNDETPPVSFAIADARDIGKIVSPVSYQALPAPGADPALVPVPESAPGTTIRSYPPADPYIVPSMPVPGVPSAGFVPGAPGYPVGPAYGAEGFPLYPRVKVEDRDHIHPCAVPTVVQVLDPCTVDDHHGLFHRHHVAACDACGPQCVYVEICAPPGCPKVKVSRNGRKVKYDYGDYKVEVESKDGYVEVDYDD